MSQPVSSNESADGITYFVKWSKEDGEFVATTPEFPSISWLDEDEGKAVEGLKALVSEIRKDSEA